MYRAVAACLGVASLLVAASAQVVTLSPDPLNLTTLAAGTLTVTLPAPAGSGGQAVTLSSSDPGVASVPNSVTVLQGAASADITVTPGAVGSATVLAFAPGFPGATATVNVAALRIGVVPDASVVGLTRTIGGTVTLSGPAPAGGTTIALSSNPSGALDLEPSPVVVPAGATSARFTLTGLVEGPALITASSPGFLSGSANVSVGKLGQIVLPANVTLGPSQTAPFPIFLVTPAPVGGVTITLTSSDPGKVTISPLMVMIPAGAQAPSFQPQVTGVNLGSAIITASAPGFAGDSEPVSVGGSLSFSPPSITFGTNSIQNLTLLLSSPVPAGVTVNLSSDNPAVASVPPTATFAPNASSVLVPVMNRGAGSTVIRASLLPNLAETTALVVVANFGSLGLPATVTLAPGQSMVLPVGLPGPAPGGGVSVTLTNSDPSKVALSTTSVFIPGGSTAPVVEAQLTGLDFGSSTVTASSAGYAAASSSVSVVGSLSFAPPAVTIMGAVTQNLVLNLSAPAPASGLMVNLSSNNAAVGSVPASVTFAPGTATVNVPVTAGAAGVAVISASANAPNVAAASATVTVVPAGAILLPSGFGLAPGQTAAFPVTLSSPAPAGGLTVTLSSGDPSKVTIAPLSVLIAAGATMPDTQPMVTGVNFGSAVIGASAPGFTPASQAVTVGAALNFTPPTLSIQGTTTQNLTLTLSAPAPAGGLMVSLISSNPGVAAVGATAVFPANATSVQVPVTGVTSGNSTVSASASGTPNVSGASATVTVTNAAPLGAIILPAGVSTGPSQAVPFAVSLSAAAPAGGVTVTLSSADPATATIFPQSVSIAAGATTPASQPQVTGVNFGTALISASAPGFTSASQSVQVGAALSLTPAVFKITGTATQNLSLKLSAPAPAAGLTVSLSSSDPGVATVQATVAIAGNATSVNVPVTGVAPGSAVISASVPGIPTVTGATASATVVPAPDIILPMGLAVAPGDQVRFQVSLAKPAPPGGVFVNLSSGDSSKFTLSTSAVFIAEGSTTAVSQPAIFGVSAGSALLNASAANLIGDSEVVQVGAGLSFLPGALSITGNGVASSFTLMASSPAPAGGLLVNLSSSNPGVATVPSSVLLPANSSSVAVPVTSVSAGSAVIHASALPTYGDTTALVTVTNSGGAGIGLPTGVTLPAGSTIVFPITLSAPAPAGGVFVTLASSDTSKVTIGPVNVFIPEGETLSTKVRLSASSAGTVTISASAAGFATAMTTVQATP